MTDHAPGIWRVDGLKAGLRTFRWRCVAHRGLPPSQGEPQWRSGRWV